jgi:polyisoprenoid-binding protein YceI
MGAPSLAVRLAVVATALGAVRPALPEEAPPPSGGSHHFRVEPSASRVTIKVGKAGLFKFAGHEHEITAPVSSGEVVADAQDLARSSVHLVFRADALKVTGADEPANDVPKIEATMAGASVLDAAHFAEIRFDSRRVSGKKEADGAWAILVAGDLGLRSASRPLEVPLRVELTGDRLVASGRTTIKQTDFGIEPVSVAGVVNVKDQLVVEFRVAARAGP